MAPLQFSFPLSHTPAYPDAVQWSQDDLLAVAAGAVVVILNPFNLGGPRACAAGAPPDVGPLVADCVPQRPQSCLKFSVAALEEMRLRDAAWRAPARSLAWSPRGCAPDGGCLLARVLADHQVLVDAAPVEKISANWVTMANLTKPLCEHVRKQDLEVSYCAHLTEMSLGGPGLLSTSPGKGERSCETQPDEMPLGTPGPLSGGPKQKEQVCKQQQPTTSGRGHGRPRTRPPSSTAPHAYCPAKGDSVEVANKGEGLGGCWFRAKVQDVRDDGFALVQYLDLSLDGKGKEPRREWFPFCRLEMSCPPTGIADDCEVHMDRRHHRMRPTPPDDMLSCGTPREAGEHVEVYADKRWWKARVLGLEASQAYSVEVKLTQERKEISRYLIRNVLVWKRSTWSFSKKRTVKGKKASAKLCGRKRSRNGETSSERRSGSHAESSGQESEGLEGTCKSKHNKLSPPPDAHNAELAAARGPRVAHRVRKMVKKRLPKPKIEVKSKEEPKPFRVPSSFTEASLAHLGPVPCKTRDEFRLQLPRLFTKRWLELRSQLPAEDLQEYVKGAGCHLAGVDKDLVMRVKEEILKIHGEKMNQFDITEKMLIKTSRVYIREALTKGKTLDDLMNRSGHNRGNKPGMEGEIYNVPDDFDPRLLLFGARPPPDSKAELNSMLPKIVRLRFLHLRCAYPADQLPNYRSQLKTAKVLEEFDMNLFQQAISEVMHVFGPSMAKHGLDRKWLSKRATYFVKYALFTCGTSNRGSTMTAAEHYRVPEDFDPKTLGEARTDSAEHLSFDLPRVCFARWMELRSQVPEELENYEKNDEMQGVDVELLNRALAEAVHVHREAMVEHKLDEAYLRKRTRVLIRNHVIVTKDAAHRTDGQAQYRQKSMQHLLNLGSRVLKEEVADEGAPGLTGASPDQEADGDCEPGGLPAQPGTEDTNIEDGFPAFEATPFGSAENCEGRDDAYKILSRFQDRAAKLLNTAAFPPSTRNPFSSITVHTAAGARRSYNSKRPHQGQRLQVTRGTTVGNEMYEGRIARQAASSTTWSPVVRTSSNGRVAFLFVGTQAGHILVWKYQCPTFQGRLATMAAGDPFVLMGCVQSHSSGVTSLKCDVMNVPVDGKKPSGTMNVVVLVSGSVTGEVRVHGADAQDLALLPDATLPLGSVLSAWGPIVGPDLRPVTCMALGSLGGPQGERYVVVAVGKTVGTVVLWKSVDVQRLSTVEAAAWIQEGHCTTKGKAHGASTVTGVTWLAAGIACSASQEGGLKSWQFEGANVKEVAPPQYGPSPGLYESPVPNGEMFAFHGIAPSGNGLLLAVLHDRGEKHWDAQASRMNFDRLIGADIRILRICGSGAPLTTRQAAMTWAQDVSAGRSPQTCPMDVAAAVLTAADELPTDEDSDEDSETDDGLHGSEVAVRVEKALQKQCAKLAMEVLQSLEEPALQLMESLRTVDDNGGEPPYNHLHCHALRSATCLRHLLKELSGAWTCNEAGAATPEQSLEGLETPRLEKCELQLLQHHMLWVLSCKGDTLCRLVSAEGLPCCGGAGSLWRCIHGVMSAWVSMHRGHTDIWPEICCIVDAMEESGNGTTPDERVSLSDVPVSLTGGPLASARSASVSVADFRIELPRCSTTMLVCERPPQWHCVVCNRGYALPPQALYGDDGLPPECLFCGMRLTTMTTRHVLAAPGSLRPTLRASGT